MTLALVPFVRQRCLGEVLIAPMDVVLDRDNALVVQPDLLFVAEERRDIVEDRVYGAPDLVIEVLSPRTRIGRLDRHLGWFSKYGVRECWLANVVSRQVAVLSLGVGGVTGQAVFSDAQPVRSQVLGDLEVSPLQIFGWPPSPARRGVPSVARRRAGRPPRIRLLEACCTGSTRRER